MPAHLYYPTPRREWKPIWIVQFPYAFCFFFVHFYKKNEAILHPKTQSYTLSFTRNHQQILEVLSSGVGNVGYFSKTFFSGREEALVLQNIGLLWAKVRMFCIESTDVCLKEVRCFCFPIRWKAWNTDFADLAEENRFYVLPLNHLQQHMGKTSGKLQYFFWLIGHFGCFLGVFFGIFQIA